MKRIILSLLSLSILLSITPLNASEAQEPSFILKVVTEQANIREKPDLGSQLICQVPEGTILESFGKTGEWYLVILKPEKGTPITGYVHESLVERVKEIPPTTRPVEIKKPEESVKKEEKEVKPIIHRIPAITIPEKPKRIQYAFSFSGGSNYISGEDLNKGTGGFAQFFDDELGIEGEVQANPLHLGYVIGGELSAALAPELLLAFGVDYFLAAKESLIEYDANASKVTLSSRPKIQSIPIRIALIYYFLPSFYVKGGVEYHFAKCSYFNRFDGTTSWEEKSGQAHGHGFGILAAAGAELPLAPNLAFFLEATGRYARVSRLKGEGVRLNSNGFNSTEQGSLYLYHRLSSNQNTFPQVEIRERRPSAGGEIDPRREAFLDLSGISLKMGFRIMF